MANTKAKKSKKNRLTLLSLLLFLSIILLSTSTYAWFTANRTVTIEDINVKVETSGGLQLSVDGANWKTVISNEDILDGSYDEITEAGKEHAAAIVQFPSVIQPMSSVMAVDANGQLEMYSSVIGTDQEGNFTLATTKETDTTGDAGKYIAFDLFLKNESSGADDVGNIYLTNGSDVTKKGETASDMGLKNASRVAFVIQGNDTNTNKTAADYINLKPAEATTNGSNVVLWEPNVNAHTESGATSATYYFNQSTAPATDDTAPAIEYLGVNQAFTALPLRYSQQTTDNRAKFTAINAANMPALKYIKTKNPAGYTVDTPRTNDQVFQGLGITKVRVYLWIEGQDVDCENKATGTEITYKMVFSKDA